MSVTLSPGDNIQQAVNDNPAGTTRFRLASSAVQRKATNMSHWADWPERVERAKQARAAAVRALQERLKNRPLRRLEWQSIWRDWGKSWRGEA